MLACGAAVAAPASALADISDHPSGAVQFMQPPSPELIDRPGDRDWYAAPSTGRDDDIKIAYFVSVQVTADDASCPAAAPLLVGMHNPEGHWMRTIRVKRGPEHTSIAIPASDGTYLLAMSAADPGCSGLQYLVPRIGAVLAGSVTRGADECRIAKGVRNGAVQAVTAKEKQLRNARSSGAKKRLNRDLKRLRRTRDAKIAEARRAC